MSSPINTSPVVYQKEIPKRTTLDNPRIHSIQTISSRDSIKTKDLQFSKCRFCLKSPLSILNRDSSSPQFTPADVLLERVCRCAHPSLLCHEECLYVWLRMTKHFYCDLCQSPFTLPLPSGLTTSATISNSSVSSCSDSRPKPTSLWSAIKLKFSRGLYMWNLYQEDSSIADDLNLVLGITVEVIIWCVLMQLLRNVELFPKRVCSWVTRPLYYFMVMFIVARLILTIYQWRRLWRLARNVNRQHFTEIPIEFLQLKMDELLHIEASEKYAQQQAKIKMKAKRVQKILR